jgi:hypothetical protein
MPLGMIPVGMMTIIVALVILGDADVDVVIHAKNQIEPTNSYGRTT